MKKYIYIIIGLLAPILLDAQNNIVQVEYWFDGDYDSHIEQDVGLTTNLLLSEILDVSELIDGLHTITYRFKDNRGVWGSPICKFFSYDKSTKSGIQVVEELEYWFDGNYASSQSVIISGQNYTFNELLDVSTLTNGLHTVSYRVKDNRGIWSSPLNRFFSKESCNTGIKELTKLQYWFNEDFTNVTTQNITTTINYNLNENVDISALPKGVHSVHYRFQDELGKWSTVYSSLFGNFGNQVTPQMHPITAMEYWFNGDISTITKSSVTATENFSLDNKLDVSELGYGIHYISYRFQDEIGRWSTAYTNFFYVSPEKSATEIQEVVEFEYWFNGDRTTLSTESVSQEIALKIGHTLDVSSLQHGLHILSYRFKDKAGRWSTTVSKFFSNYPAKQPPIENNIVAYRYWINSDLTTLQRAALETPVTIFNLDQILTASQLPSGTNNLSYQFQDQQGNWSTAITESYTREAQPAVNILASEIEICQGETINFTADISDADQVEWDFGDGKTSNENNPTHTFETAGTFNVSATVTDSESGQSATENIEGIIVNSSYVVNHSRNEAVEDFIDEDFESNPITTLPDDWFVLPGYSGTGTENQKIVDTPVRSGSQSIQTESLRRNAGFVGKTIPELPDKVTLEGWVYPEKILSGITGGIGLGAIGNDMGVGIINGNFTAGYWDGGSPVNYILQPYVPETWYHIRMNFNMQDRTCQVYINNSLVPGTLNGVTTNSIPMHSQPVDLVKLHAGNSGLNRVYFDDIKLYEGWGDVRICENNLPFVFGEQLLTESGTYTETFQTIHGCDSTVTLNLIVNEITTTQIADTIFEDEFPYSFGALQISSSGTYSQTFVNNKGCDSIVELSLFTWSEINVCSTIQFESGWNIFSVNNLPDPGNMDYLFESLIGNNHLIKIQNEKGISLENWGIFGGWQNNIGNISPQEGYKIKVNTTDSIKVCGSPVSFPYAIPLESGWNIIGFPHYQNFNAMDVVQNLINKGCLIKVQDEKGNSIENWGIFGGWQNNIANFVQGKGYKVKVNTIDTIWIESSYNKSLQTFSIPVATKHFKPDFDNNGFDHMNINLVDFPKDFLNLGDEIAAFDGEYCVGAILVTEQHIKQNTIPLITSANDDKTSIGFKEGNTIILKFWSKAENIQYSITGEVLSGSKTYLKHETSIFSLKNITDTNLIDKQLELSSDLKLYPNPTNGQVNISLNLPEYEEIEVQVLDIESSEVFRKKYWIKDQIKLDLSEHVSGTYMIIIDRNNSRIVRKLVLDKR